MRKYVRDQIIELLSTIGDGVKQAVSLQAQAAERVLADCSLAAGTVERALRDGFSRETFSAYEASLALLQTHLEEIRAGIEQGALRAAGVPKVKFLLKQLRKRLLHEPEVRLELVFLPYKASMWDALESVWRAAREDPGCEVFVVPIPYYERNSDFSFGARRYEGDMFPNYVPVTHYEAYDVKLRRPDAVYIHNPYDAYNYVTSVDPRYYAEELKKYTDLLVYIPYFVTAEVSPSFCQTAGVLHADKVIVRTQQEQQRYAHISGQAAEKFLPLGSPKFDRVVSSRPEDFILPEAWQRRIGGRKVILYNTHLNSIINHPDKLLRKLESVFSYFKRRDDAVLWWRPHPLSRQTASSMQPEFYRAYCALEDWYRQNEIGIYDDSPELYRAFVCSDAYFGDNSSLVLLYRSTGKPMMLQNMDHCPEGQEVYADFTDFAIDGTTLYFSAFYFNGLFKFDLQTQATEFLGRFPGENAIAFNSLRAAAITFTTLYGGVIRCADKLFFAPLAAREIAVYDLQKCCFYKIPLPQMGACCNENRKFFSCVAHDKYVFIIGAFFPAIARIDAQTLEVEWFTQWYDEYKDVWNPTDTTILFGRQVLAMGNRLYIPCSRNNMVLVFDMDTGKGIPVRVGQSGNRYFSICREGQAVWLVPRNRSGNFVRWNRKAHTQREFPLPWEAWCPMFFFFCAAREGKLLLYTQHTPILQFSPQTGALKPLEQEPAVSGYRCAGQVGGDVYALAAANGPGNFVRLRAGKETVLDRLTVPLPPAAVAEARAHFASGRLPDSEMPLYENPVIDLHAFVDFVTSGAHAVERAAGGAADLCGKRIHEAIRQSLKEM